MHLSSLTSSARHAVEGTLVGDTYRRRREHVVEEDSGAQRVYVPLVDGEDRLGVLSALVDDASAALVEDVQLLASAAAGLSSASGTTPTATSSRAGSSRWTSPRSSAGRSCRP